MDDALRERIWSDLDSGRYHNNIESYRKFISISINTLPTVILINSKTSVIIIDGKCQDMNSRFPPLLVASVFGGVLAASSRRPRGELLKC